MHRYFAQRVATAIPTMIGVSLVTFALLHVVPGGPVVAMLGLAATNAAAVAAVTKELGLDRPIWEQYVIWLKHALSGDLGTSTEFHVPVLQLIGPKLAHTLILTAGSLCIAAFFGVILGITTAVYHRSLYDRAAMLIMLIGASAPVFWIGLLLSYLFAIRLGWLPAMGMTSITGDASPMVVLRHLLLPAFANSIISLAVIARIVRSNMLEALVQPYVLAARARGLSRTRQVVVHAFRNVLPDAINITGLQVGFLFGGALFVEVVFAWPGIGYLIYSSIQARDYLTLQASVLVVSAVFVLVNLVADMARIALDPRERVG
jgi:peptide/nickel transport system permease protein